MTKRATASAAIRDEDLSFFDVVNVILRRRRLVLLFAVGAGLAFAAWGLLQGDRYTASATFIPRSTANPETGLMSMARQFGVNIRGDQRGHSPAFYGELLRSREILHQAVESEYRPSGSDDALTLIDWYGVGTEMSDYGPAWLHAVQKLRNDITVSVRNETGLIHLAVSSHDPAMAEQVAERLLQLVHNFNLESRQEQAAEEQRFASERLVDAGAELAAAEADMKRFLEQNRSFGSSPDLAFEHERLERQVYMRQELYSSLLEAHEQARIEAVRDIPLISVVASPEGSAQPEGLSITALALLGGSLGVLLASAIAFSLELGRRARAEGLPQYNEYARLRAETLTDLRHPVRLINPRA